MVATHDLFLGALIASRSACNLKEAALLQFPPMILMIAFLFLRRISLALRVCVRPEAPLQGGYRERNQNGVPRNWNQSFELSHRQTEVVFYNVRMLDLKRNFVSFMDRCNKSNNLVSMTKKQSISFQWWISAAVQMRSIARKLNFNKYYCVYIYI
jgi:DNA-binding CsgD family transcriptional regulator